MYSFPVLEHQTALCSGMRDTEVFISNTGDYRQYEAAQRNQAPNQSRKGNCYLGCL